LPPVASLLAVAALCAATGASAANWEIAPRLAGGYKYSDNYRLGLPGTEIDVSGAEADAQVTFRTLDPRTTFSLTPRVRSTYFPDAREEDSNDYFLNAALEDKTPRRRTGFKFNGAREDVVRSELPSAEIESDLGDVDPIDAGRTIERNRRDLLRLAPYFSYDLSQRYQLDLDAYFVDADYDLEFAGRQQDFRQYGAGAGVGFLVSQRSSLSVRGLAAQYETATDAQAYGAELEWDTALTETSRTYVRAGAQRTEPDNRPSETNVIAGIGGSWSSQRNDLFLDFTRSIGAAAAGTIVERHQLRVRVDHAISPLVSMLVGVNAFRDEAAEDLSTYPTRKYITAETGVEWRINRAFSVLARYNYLWQEYDDEPSDATANGFLISLVYEPKRAD
jgi:hypothetical protein